ncbi:vWA domain-containing protein [Leucobacter sp. M11]|uniref:vWA domain-containing protein n=1 Tax=Leucobacter sp. M11 TaxID=2993565 RepID=UPI002D810F2B|nr:vWA domain-containing protein [Leucobacter sp. M11]MEB4613598.1 VWA domain-containing protein [Leucobacter sp. M11]
MSQAPSVPESRASEWARLRARFGAVGRLLGVPITVTEDLGWELDGSGLRLGLGYYSGLGHPEDEAEARALLDLWVGLRFGRVAPVRVRRQEQLAHRRPELEPLLAAIDRIQASGELLATLPALRGPLERAAQRGVPADLTGWPRHLQWAGAVQLAALAPRHPVRVSPEVAEELTRLAGLGGGGGDALRRVAAPDAARGQLARLERALGLLVPPADRLLALDVAARGLAAEGEAQPPAPAEDGDAGAGLALGAGEAADAQAGEGEAGEEASSAEPDDGAEHRQDPADAASTEGADLFASDRGAFVSTILPTPMPAADTIAALLQALPEGSAFADAPPPEGDPRSPAAAGPAPAGDAAGAAQLRGYRERVLAQREAVDRMRQTWQRVISERLAPRPVLSRRPFPEGDSLDAEALARVVAESLAGVPRPSAYRRRERAPRRGEDAGRTDYVLLLDRSGSMQGLAADAASDAALIMLEGLAGAERDIAAAERETGAELGLGIRTALIVFDAEPTVVKPLAGALDDASRQRLDLEIRSPRGSTNDGAALRAAAEQLGVLGARLASDGEPRRRIVILVSDGGSNDPVVAAAELKRLRAAGVTVFGLGLGTDDLVQRFAPGGRRLDDPRALPEVLRGLIEAEQPGGTG